MDDPDVMFDIFTDENQSNYGDFHILFSYNDSSQEINEEMFEGEMYEEERFEEERFQEKRCQDERFQGERFEEDRFEEDRFEEDRFEEDRFEEDRFEEDRFEEDRFEEDRFEEDRFEKGRFEEDRFEDRFQEDRFQEEGRFKEISNRDVENFINQQENNNTKKKTINDMRIFKEFLIRTGERTPPNLLSPEDLSKLVSRFLLSVRKRDGSEYEPSSLRGFYSSIDRHLRQNSYPCSLVNSRQFSKCREALKSKQKQLKSVGKGNKPQTAEELTDEDINHLYESGQLGMSTPFALINTLWLNNMLYFGMRGGVEQHSLKWGDIELQSEADGRRYIIYSQERQTKTRSGENPRNIRQVKPRAYETPDQPERDPVKIYIEYSNRRPKSMMGPDDAFFLAINDVKSSSNDRVWFKRQNMGINKIYSLMKTMKTNAHLPENKKLTNHSARKHLLQKLNDSNIPPNQIIQISGHKNVNSVNNYCSLNSEQQAKISNILSNNNSCKSLQPVSFPGSNVPSESLYDNSAALASPAPAPAPACQRSTYGSSSTLSSSQYSHADTRALFQGSTFNNSVVNVYCHPPIQQSPKERPAKLYQRILPLPSESDSD